MMTAVEDADILHIKCVADAARDEFTNILAEVDGPKDVVIQSELMSLLNHVTPFSFLKKLDVDHVFKLEAAMNMGRRHRFYITRPDLLAVSQIAAHIVTDQKEKQVHEYRIIFVPRILVTTRNILEEEGVHGLVKILEWNLHLIPLDAHLLSLERYDTFRLLYITQDYTLLHSIARSLLVLEGLYGVFPLVHGKGHFAQMVWDLFKRLKEIGDRPVFGRISGIGISEVVLFDRQCDLVTPLCSQLTYEGILDDVFRIQGGYVSISKEVTGKEQDTKILLNAKDPVFTEIRGLHFSAASPILAELSKNLKVSYREGKSVQSIPAMKNFVRRLPELTKKHDSLTTHVQVSEHIVSRKKREDFSRHLFYERAILEAADKTPVTDYIEELIHCQVDYHLPLRLLCLMSTTNNGIKNKYLVSLKDQYLRSYGHKHLVTFQNLQTVGLIQHKAEEQSGHGSGSQHTKSTFKQLTKQLKLVPKDPGSYDIYSPKDMSYVYGGAFKPLSCATVEHVIKTRSWKGLDDVVRSWSGPAFTHTQSTTVDREASLATHKVVLVYFIGGCTFSEINALRFLGEKTNTHYIIATTNIISPNTLIESVMFSLDD